MNMVSSCCGKSTYEGIKREYPLGGSVWGINYKVICCERCNEECDEIPACDFCGEAGDLVCIGGNEHICPDCHKEFQRMNPEVQLV